MCIVAVRYIVRLCRWSRVMCLAIWLSKVKKKINYSRWNELSVFVWSFIEVNCDSDYLEGRLLQFVVWISLPQKNPQVRRPSIVALILRWNIIVYTSKYFLHLTKPLAMIKTCTHTHAHTHTHTHTLFHPYNFIDIRKDLLLTTFKTT